jgi:YHS domain-containing protein
MKRQGILFLSVALLLMFFVWANGWAQEVRDPVCGMKLDASRARFSTEYQGQKYYFCSADCLAKFEANPAQYIGKSLGCEEEETICCSLPAELLREAKVERKETPDGFLLTITSDNPEVARKLQETIGQCQKEMKAGEKSGHTHGEHMVRDKNRTCKGKNQACCLMCDEGYEKRIIKLSQGVRLELKRKNLT